jgi:hypothetical protein
VPAGPLTALTREQVASWPLAPTVRPVGNPKDVTANSGADTASDEAVTTTEHDDTEPTKVDYQGVNNELRRRFLECNRSIKQAQADGDVEAERRARAERDRIGQAFYETNLPLAVTNARPIMIGDADVKKEHLAAAVLGMWEAFVGVDASKVDDVLVDADGAVHAAAGWDPDKGAFSTWAGSFISGRAKRSVKTVESAYNGISYNTWSAKPKVDRARVELTTELGRSPSIAEIAVRAEVTEATVRAVSKPAPVSLQTVVSGDGDTTLGDLLADTAELEDVDVSMFAEAELVRRAADMHAFDLLVLLLRSGITGRPSCSVVRTADKLCVNRGSVGIALGRAEKILNKDGQAIAVSELLELAD